MRRMVPLGVCLFVALLAAHAAHGNAEPSALLVGEKLYYRIFWGPLLVGTATMEVRNIEPINGHPCYHLVAEMRTAGPGRLLYPIDSRSESWLDVKELYSRRFSQDRREGKRVIQREVDYDPVAGEMVMRNLRNHKEKRSPLPRPGLDVLACMYYLRTRPLSVDLEEKFVLITGDETFDVSVRPDVSRKMEVRPVGEVVALRLEPKPAPRFVVENGGRFWVWVSDDARQLPLIANSTMQLGTAKMTLYQVDTPAPPATAAVPQPGTTRPR